MENPHKKKNWNQKYLSNMKYKSFKRKHYYISKLNGEETYIIGYNYDKKEGFMLNTNEVENRSKFSNENISDIIKSVFERDFMTYEKDIMYKGWSILDSLLSLRQRLDYPYDINENTISDKELIELEENLSNNNRKEIIKWLKIYGMPFLGDKYIDNHMIIGIPPFSYGFKNDIYTCYKNKACVCRLGSFLISLNIIFHTFILFLSYADKMEVLEELYFDENNYDEVDRSSYIRRALSSISDKAIINLDNILKQNQLSRFEGCMETIISLAMYQLAIIASSYKIQTAKKCNFKDCKNIFIPTRRTRDYCMHCSRQKQYKKEHNCK
ncbi:MAG: hypothetical protein HFJ41_03690 [Clostridia bacterium]|nr:hypothetical protein [Clostridia bacterium]